MYDPSVSIAFESSPSSGRRPSMAEACRFLGCWLLMYGEALRLSWSAVDQSFPRRDGSHRFLAFRSKDEARQMVGLRAARSKAEASEVAACAFAFLRRSRGAAGNSAGVSCFDSGSRYCI